MDRLLVTIDNLVQGSVLGRIVNKVEDLMLKDQVTDVGACWVTNHNCTNCNDDSCAACPECGWRDCSYLLTCGSWSQWQTYGECC